MSWVRFPSPAPLYAQRSSGPDAVEVNRVGAEIVPERPIPDFDGSVFADHFGLALLDACQSDRDRCRTVDGGPGKDIERAVVLPRGDHGGGPSGSLGAIRQGRSVQHGGEI